MVTPNSSLSFFEQAILYDPDYDNKHDKDIIIAIGLYTLASKEGDYRAKCALACIYDPATQLYPGIIKDGVKAVNLYNEILLINKDNTNSKMRLAYLYNPLSPNFNGIIKDGKKSEQIYKDMISNNQDSSGNAKYSLAQFYDPYAKEIKGVSKDIDKTFSLYSRAMTEGSNLSIGYLAFIYTKKDNKYYNIRKSVELYKKALDNQGKNNLQVIIKNLSTIYNDNNDEFNDIDYKEKLRIHILAKNNKAIIKLIELNSENLVKILTEHDKIKEENEILKDGQYHLPPAGGPGFKLANEEFKQCEQILNK